MHLDEALLGAIEAAWLAARAEGWQDPVIELNALVSPATIMAWDREPLAASLDEGCPDAAEMIRLAPLDPGYEFLAVVLEPAMVRVLVLPTPIEISERHWLDSARWRDAFLESRGLTPPGAVPHESPSLR